MSPQFINGTPAWVFLDIGYLCRNCGSTMWIQLKNVRDDYLVISCANPICTMHDMKIKMERKRVYGTLVDLSTKDENG